MPEWVPIEGVGNLAEWLAAVCGLALVVVAFLQLRLIARQQSKWATLQACNAYDTDPIIQAAVRLISRHVDDPNAVSDSFSLGRAATTLLNFFDAIAIGLKQELYDEKIVVDHLQNIIFTRLTDIQRSSTKSMIDASSDMEICYPNLVALVARWKLELDK